PTETCTLSLHDAFRSVDDTHTFWSQTQSHETLLSFYPKTVRLQVWQKTTLGVVFCVGNIVAGNRALTSNLTYFGHFIASLKKSADRKSTRLNSSHVKI